MRKRDLIVTFVNMSASKMASVSELPNELLVEVFSMVPCASLLQIRLVSKHWKHLAETDALWSPVLYSILPDNDVLAMTEVAAHLGLRNVGNVDDNGRTSFRKFLWACRVALMWRKGPSKPPRLIAIGKTLRVLIDNHDKLISTHWNGINMTGGSCSVRCLRNTPSLIGTTKLTTAPIVTIVVVAPGVVWSGAMDGKITAWQLETGEAAEVLHEADEGGVVALHSNGRQRAVTGTINGVVRLWEIDATGMTTSCNKCTDHKVSPMSICLSTRCIHFA